MSEELVTVLEFERQVLRAEGINIVVRAPANTKVQRYKPLPNPSRNSLWVERFITGHLRPQVNGLAVEVIAPNGKTTFGKIPLSNVRVKHESSSVRKHKGKHHEQHE